MLKVTVKTLDSQNHSFEVPDESTVKEFKEQIAPVLNIAVDKQRLIFCGKVLKDDKKLSEYDVDGKVLHVVQSLPPQGNSNSAPSSASGSTTNGSGSRGSRDASGFLLGAFSIPQELVDPSQVQNIVHDVVSGMGDIGRNATVMSRASDDGTVDVHINLGRMPVNVPMNSEAQLRMNRVQTMLLRANHLLDTLEDGSSSNNGAVADSSSQTETGSNDTENTAMESEPSVSSSFENPLNTLNSLIHNLDVPSSTEVTSEINMDVPSDLTINPERFRFEGLAHAAQAAISAAFATAAAAAREAAHNAVGSSVPLDLRTVSAEPMEESSTEPPPADFMDTIPVQEFIVDLEPTSSTESVTTIKPEPKSDSASSSQTPQPSTSSAAPNSSNGSTPTPPRTRRPVQPSVQTLGNLLDEVIRFNARLQPSLERVRDLLRTDAPLSGRPCADAQRLYSRISQMLHFLSHAFHSLSDLHVNFTHAPPRSPRVRIISSTPASMLQGLPMQAQISITTSSSPSANSNTTTTANTNATSENTPSSTSEVRSSPQVITQAPTPTTDTTTSSRAQTPLVFMEVSPTFSIDSIASMVTPELNNAASSLFNIVRGADGSFLASSSNGSTANSSTPFRATAPTPAEANTDTSRSTPRTTPSSAPPSGNGPVPPLSIPFRNLIPVPLTSMGSLHTFDSGLPCHSVWALEPSRRRHNAGGSRTPNAHQQPTLTPNFPGRQEDQLQQVISNIVMSLLNNGHNPPSQGQTATNVTVLNARSGDAARENPTFTTRFSTRNVGQERLSRPERSASPANRAPRSASAGITFNSNHSMSHMLSNLGLANKNLAEVFTGMRSHNFDILGEFFQFIASHLTFQNVVDFGEGDFECLTRIQSLICSHLREKVFKATNPNASHYKEVLEKILADKDINFSSFLELAGVSDSSTQSYIEAFETLLRENIHKIFDALLNRDVPSSTTYGQNIANICKEIFEKFLQLHARFSNRDSLHLERVLRRQLEPLVAMVEPGYQSVVRVLILSSLYRLTSHTRNAVPSSGESSEPTSSTSSVDANKKKEEKKAETNDRPPQRAFSFNSRVDTGDIFPTRNISAGTRPDDASAPALAAFARIAEQTSAFIRGNNRSNENRPSVAEVVIRPESWHNAIPQDWVPIITRDVQRQRRQAPQAPFSNAYLGGMPSKRRKIMTNEAPALLEHSQTTLSDMLLQAISSADVKPKTSIEEVKAEVSRDTEIQASFKEHMKHSIQERLQRDLDYCSDKFPNSEKYYNI